MGGGLMHGEQSVLLRPALAAISLLACTALAAAQPTAEPTLPPLAPELLEARTVCVMPSTFAKPDSRFKRELKKWGRFELVMFPDEADLLMVLDAEYDFIRKLVDSEEPEEGNPLEGRAIGTARVLDKLYLRVFVQGGEDLWKAEVEVGDEDEAGKILVDQLRARLEAEEAEYKG